MQRLLALAMFLAVAAPGASAEPGAAGRFSFVPAESGVFRLDTETGGLTLCVERSGSLVCMRAPVLHEPGPVAPNRAATGEAERVAALESRIAALEARPGESGPARSEAVGRVRLLAGRMMGRLAALVRGMKGAPAGEES